MTSWLSDTLKACMPRIRRDVERTMADRLDRELARRRGNTLNPTGQIRVTPTPLPLMTTRPRDVRQDHRMTDIDELVLWLREQIAEKRRRALATSFLPDGPAPAWTYNRYEFGVTWRDHNGYQIGVASHRSGAVTGLGRYQEAVLDADGQHMELNDPQAAVAECDAHERMVDALSEDANRASGQVSADALGPLMVAELKAQALLKVLATAYRHRPGYREEWRP